MIPVHQLCIHFKQNPVKSVNRTRGPSKIAVEEAWCLHLSSWKLIPVVLAMHSVQTVISNRFVRLHQTYPWCAFVVVKGAQHKDWCRIISEPCVVLKTIVTCLSSQAASFRTLLMISSTMWGQKLGVQRSSQGVKFGEETWCDMYTINVIIFIQYMYIIYLTRKQTFTTIKYTSIYEIG